MFKLNARRHGPTPGQWITLALAAAVILSLFAVVPRAQADPQSETDFPDMKAFACGHAGRLHMRIDDRFSAVVLSPGGQRFLLTNVPVEHGVVRIRWSDGVHTLTWDPGVHLTWRESAKAQPIACSREGGHKHGAAQPAAVTGHEHHKPPAT
jgi:hypothetical protein